VNAETRGFSRRASEGESRSRDTDDARILAKKIKGLYGFLGKANDALWRKHPSALQQCGGEAYDKLTSAPSHASKT
jgi:hypothetical protein